MRAAIFIPVLLVGGLVGCASTGVRPSLVNQEEAAYAYPLEEVWPVVQAWYRERGFQYRDDAARFVLQTEWREEFAGSRVAGYWHRYTVVGKRVGPSRSKVWVIRASRSPEQAPIHDVRQPEWTVDRLPGPARDGLPTGGLRVEEYDVRMPDAEAPLRFVPPEAVTNLTLPLGEPGVAGESAHGTRDLSLEWVLRDQVVPVLEARTQGQPAPVLAATKQEPGGSSMECGLPIIGLAEKAQRGTVMLLGEMHGTQEVPRFVALGTCQVASSGTPVTVGLEMPVENQERVKRFVASAGTEQDHALLMESPFWRNPYPDGRGSQAVAHLLEQLRWLRAQGLDVRVFVFDHPELQGEAREAAMAQSILSEMAPERFALVVTGNIHPRINPGVPWDLGYRPMGYLLSRKLPSVLSLDVAFDSGTAWICAVDEKKALECGVQEAKGRDNGDRSFVFTFDKPSESGYHGIFYVGPVSASPPAVRPGSPHPN